LTLKTYRELTFHNSSLLAPHYWFYWSQRISEKLAGPLHHQYVDPNW